MSIKSLFLLAAAPIALASAPHALAQAAGGPAPGVTTQLPRNAVPHHYAIRVTPDAQNLRFTGQVVIDLDVTQPTQTLVLNAADLTIAKATIAPAGGKAIAGTAKVDADAQTVTLDFGKPLKAGKYSLAMDYAGIINTQANGLFALDYKDSAGADKRALFTQFEAPDARRFVPSWDEPSYKATFDLTAIVPTGQFAVGNMPIKTSKDLGGGKTEVTFGTSPKMSSYLLFFGLGDLERATKMAGQTEIGIITGKGNSGKATLALDAAAEVLTYYNDYFGVPFPLPKLDNVAGPGQSQFFSAMENWGAIFTFERAMLVDPRLTSELQKRRIYETVAHETAHQWFGDLVTMAWWDDLWLNEGFASWMATKVTEHFRPEWQMGLTRVGGRESAMGLDAYSTTHPVVQKIETVDQVNQAFDSITYEKGEAVITMLEGYAGADTWRKGLRNYMKAHAYGNTVTVDLWKAVEAAGAKGLVDIAHDYTSQPGIPLVKVDSVTCNGGTTTLNLTQAEFSRDHQDKPALSWRVPVMAQVLGGTPVRTVLIGGKGQISLPGCGAYVVNAGQTGYYRSLYPAAGIAALAKDFGNLAAIDQLGLLADNWQLAEAGYQPAAQALSLVDAVPANAGPAIQSALADYIGKIDGYTDKDPKAREKARAYGRARLEPQLTAIGFDAKAGEDPQIGVLRQSLVSTLGALESPMVLGEAKRRFAALASDPAAIDGPLRESWLRIIARNADAATWDRLRTMANAATGQIERTQLFTTLGQAKDEALAAKALDLALTDEPGKTTSAGIIAAVGGEHPMQAVDFVLAHRQAYEALIDVSARSQALARLGGGSDDPAMVTKLDGYATSFLTPQSRSVIDRAIASVKGRIATKAHMRPAIAEWLNTRK
ncbi:MAG: M1 family metallopeptidase [Sphingobium sp.]|nr:M1 family metallopeptidase [Sphingobium sp.]